MDFSKAQYGICWDTGLLIDTVLLEIVAGFLLVFALGPCKRNPANSDNPISYRLVSLLGYRFQHKMSQESQTKLPMSQDTFELLWKSLGDVTETG